MAGRPVILVAMAVALSAAGAIAADPPPAPASAQEERQICRGSTKQLGSRIRRPRRCRTAAQWQQEDEEKSRVPLSAQLTEGQNDGRTTATPR